MSLAAPTRPLPTSPTNPATDLPRANSTAGSSRNASSTLRSSPLRGGGDTESTRSRTTSERDGTSLSQTLSGQLSDSGRSALLGPVSLDGYKPPAPGIQINDMTEESVSWGANFWVTIQDPMSGAIFYACPSTGQTSWEPPVETFLMPLNDDGHWWELSDESRAGTPYYYHTKTGETQWTRPEGFVIPLGIIQTTTTLGRRLSQNTHGRSSQARSSVSSDRRISLSRSRSYGDGIPEEDLAEPLQRRPSNEYVKFPPLSHSALLRGVNSMPLSTIPGSPDATSSASSPTSLRHRQGAGSGSSHSIGSGEGGRASSPSPPRPRPGDLHRSESSPAVVPSSLPRQSFGGVAAEIIASTREEIKRAKGKEKEPSTPPISPTKSTRIQFSPTSPVARALKDAAGIPTSPKRSLPAIPPLQTQDLSHKPERTSRRRRDTDKDRDRERERERKDTETSPPNLNGVEIPDTDAAARSSPLKTKIGKPIVADPEDKLPSARLSTGDHHILPRPLAADIEQFAVADFAKRYFSTHKTGLIFKRRVPVEQMMSWQKAPLQAPLLVLNRSLHKDAIKSFRVIQKVMGDRDREKPVGVRMNADVAAANGQHSSGSTSSLNPSAKELYGIGSILEEERWMLTEGLAHGELRDEIYCQVVKQLSNNPSPESTFHGWQLLCVLLVVFPPSKNFEAYLRSFMQERLTHTEGRIDIMAKYCVSRLSTISKKGPRGKPPTVQEIESAADAAFNPSTFGESLESIMRLQQRTYPESKVPIVLPFLADSIIALGGTKREGIFRVPGDGDTVSEMKVRIDKGHYNLQGVDDPHVPASLLKMWLRELQEPLIPVEMYDECIASAEDPDEVIRIVKKLPVLNKRVMLFIISFIQLFIPESVSSVTKMASQSLALVLAPNLLRCNSDSIAVVFANSRFEHIFVHNLLMHLKCHKIDPDYVPAHGIGSASAQGTPNVNRAKSHRRPGT